VSSGFAIFKTMTFDKELFQLAATDLSNHLACEHLTQLNKQVALSVLKRPSYRDPSLDVLIQRGKEHEAAYAAYLESKKLKIVSLHGKGVQETVDAMKTGIDVIFQAPLELGQWNGYADFLIKCDGESKFGKWMYEVQDTKLAQNTKATTILQLCLYSDVVTDLQGSRPEKMYVVKPGANFPTEYYRFDDFRAYYQLVKRNLERVISDDNVATYPNPVGHCSICNWWQVCDKKRHEDDHLSLVAGVRSLHVKELQDQGIDTLTVFAKAKEIKEPKRGNIETFVRKQDQAKVQLEGRDQNKLLYEVKKIEAGRGFYRLPLPNKGDVYFDIEGDPYYEDGGLEYLLGYACNKEEATVYEKIWATNKAEEKKAFEQFMKFIISQWKAYPDFTFITLLPTSQVP
jgi:uncharacterized protein